MKKQTNLDKIKIILNSLSNNLNYIFKPSPMKCKYDLFENIYCTCINEFIFNMEIIIENPFMASALFMPCNIEWKYDKDWEVLYPIFLWDNIIGDIIENETSEGNDYLAIIMKALKKEKCKIQQSMNYESVFFLKGMYKTCEDRAELNGNTDGYFVVVLFDFFRRIRKVINVSGYDKNMLKKVIQKTMMYLNFRILAERDFENQLENFDNIILEKIGDVKLEIEKMRKMSYKSYFAEDFGREDSIWKSLFESNDLLCKYFLEISILKENNIIDRDICLKKYIYSMALKANYIDYDLKTKSVCESMLS